MRGGWFVVGDKLVSTDAELSRVSISGRVYRHRRADRTRLQQLTNHGRRRKLRRVVVHVQNLQRHLDQRNLSLYWHIIWSLKCLLHFAWVGHASVCVSECLSVPRRIPTLLHGPGCNLRNACLKERRCLLRCALLGGFAIGARVSLLWQHCVERGISARACTRFMPVS